jgi:hypothetical protein
MTRTTPTAGAGTDVRAWWPACPDHEPLVEHRPDRDLAVTA